MKKIQYHYTNIAKQVFFIVCFIYVALNFTVMMEIAIFKLDKYYEAMNVPITIILYVSILIFLIVLFISYKFCYSVYDEHHITYYNRLLKGQRELYYSQARVAVFSTMGVKFYSSDEAAQANKKPLFFLPFFRFGKIEPIHINNFYKLLKGNETIKVIKKFKVLPGYSKKWTFVTILYGILAVVFFMNCATPITVIILLFQNH